MAVAAVLVGTNTIQRLALLREPHTQSRSVLEVPVQRVAVQTRQRRGLILIGQEQAAQLQRAAAQGIEEGRHPQSLMAAQVAVAAIPAVLAGQEFLVKAMAAGTRAIQKQVAAVAAALLELMAAMGYRLAMEVWVFNILLAVPRPIIAVEEAAAVA